MGLLPDTQNCGMRMRSEWLERYPRHRLLRKPLVNDPGMHHGTCVAHVPWCMSGSLTCGDGEIVPGIPGACATRNFAYLVRGPLGNVTHILQVYFDGTGTIRLNQGQWSYHEEYRRLDLIINNYWLYYQGDRHCMIGYGNSDFRNCCRVYIIH